MCDLFGAEAAAAGGLDPDDVPRLEIDGLLRADRTAVHEVPARPAVGSAGQAARPARAALRDEREPAILEDAELTDDAVSAATETFSARAEPQLVPLDAQRV